MTIRDAFDDVVDGDQIDDGFFNEIPDRFEVDDTDTSASNITEATNDFVLKRTFAITGVLATDALASVEVSQALLKTGGGANAASMTIAVNDGSTTWSYYEATVNSGLTWIQSAPGGPTVLTASTSSVDFNMNLPCPSLEMTGSTTWNILIYLRNADAGSTTTLDKGFKVRANFIRRTRAEGSVSDS